MMHDTLNSMMTSMGIVWLLIVILLVLAIVALIKYIVRY